MIQYKLFSGTLAEIEAALNGWAASLAPGASVNMGPITRIEGDQFFKEVMYQLPVRNNGLAVPQMKIAPN